MQGTAAYQQGGAVLVGGVVACAGDEGLEYRVSIRIDKACRWLELCQHQQKPIYC